MEPEINTLTPENPPKSSNKVLYFVFAFLLLAIIVLVIVIIVVKNTQPTVSNQPTTQMIVTNPEGLKMGEEFQAKLSSVTEEATGLLDQNPGNADKVRDLFANVIAEYPDPATFGYVQTLINTEIDLLLQHGLIEKAFEIYNLTDTYIPTDQIIQNEIYAKALTLAEQENNQSWIDIFQAKFDATLAAKQAELDAIGNAKANYDKSIEEMIKKDDEAAKQSNQTEAE